MDTSPCSGGRQRPGRLRRMLALAGLASLALPAMSPVRPSLYADEQAVAAGTSLARNLEIRKGDHISLIGNTLADRMQHDGWLETLALQPVPATRSWSIRNLGFSGDELTIRASLDRTSARPTSG